jgi:hypothetical protein
VNENEGEEETSKRREGLVRGRGRGKQTVFVGTSVPTKKERQGGRREPRERGAMNGEAGEEKASEWRESLVVEGRERRGKEERRKGAVRASKGRDSSTSSASLLLPPTSPAFSFTSLFFPLASRHLVSPMPMVENRFFPFYHDSLPSPLPLLPGPQSFPPLAVILFPFLIHGAPFHVEAEAGEGGKQTEGKFGGGRKRKRITDAMELRGRSWRKEKGGKREEGERRERGA